MLFIVQDNMDIISLGGIGKNNGSFNLTSKMMEISEKKDPFSLVEKSLEARSGF